MKKQKQITVNTSAPVRPETVQELIDFLAQCSANSKLDFGPLSLYRMKDRSGVVQFEFNEVAESADMFHLTKNDQVVDLRAVVGIETPSATAETRFLLSSGHVVTATYSTHDEAVTEKWKVLEELRKLAGDSCGARRVTE